MHTISHDSEIPAEGKQVFTACAFIHRNFDGVEKVFWPKRASTKKFLPDVRELPGGHVDFGEEMATGLQREIREEFGMDIEVGDPFFVFTYTNDVKGSHSIEVVYFARFVGDIDAIKLNPEDHSDYVWCAEDEIEANLTGGKTTDDAEVTAMRKGFGLLRGESVGF